MTLQDAWQKRLELLSQADLARAKAASLEKDCYHAPKSSKIDVWYGSMSAYYDAQFKREEISRLAYQADTVWYDAVKATKGNVRVTWEDVNGKYRCTLETGEVFEP